MAPSAPLLAVGTPGAGAPGLAADAGALADRDETIRALKAEVAALRAAAAASGSGGGSDNRAAAVTLHAGATPAHRTRHRVSFATSA